MCIYDSTRLNSSENKKNISDKSFINNFFSQKIVSAIMWNIITAVQVTDDNITGRMRSACWVTNATDTHSEYVILIAFPPQQW
jgi:spore cortex formation protein SpoVR/YcgB (stage V sporulation)